ncbi:hypothetical protein P5V15_015522 [Pogonomyrmex californicus]
MSLSFAASLTVGDNLFVGVVWSKPSTINPAINQAKYALDIGTAALELFTDMFKQKYVLPKTDDSHIRFRSRSYEKLGIGDISGDSNAV